jgi:hypothetical protein
VKLIIIIGSSLLLISKVFSQSTNHFNNLDTTNKATDIENSKESTEKAKEKPKGITLPDGTFIPNTPAKQESSRDSKMEIYKRFVQKPSFAAEMAEKGVELAQTGNPNEAIPLDYVRAMYAIAVFFDLGYCCPQSKENSLDWTTKAAYAGKMKMNGEQRSANDTFTDEEAAEASKIIKSLIAENK